MKIIEALKKIKLNEKKIEQVTLLMNKFSAKMENENFPYDKEPIQQMQDWKQSIMSLLRDNEDLLLRIFKTNLNTQVSIELPSGTVTKSISAWMIERDRSTKLVSRMSQTYTDNGLKPKTVEEDGVLKVIQVELAYNPESVDKLRADLLEVPSLIDSALEIVNATTELYGLME